MQIMEALAQPQARAALEALARARGIAPAQAEAAVRSVLPELSQRIERNTLSRGGLADMIEMLGDPRYRRAAEDPRALTSPEMQQAGIEALDRVLGNKDQSRALAARAAQASGLSEGLIKQLLPILLPIIIGWLSKSGSGSLGDVLSRLPNMPGSGSPASPDRPAPSRPSPMPRTTPPTAGDGPLPLPGSHTPIGDDANPYGDLSDMIRRGAAGGVAAGGLAGIVRSILGSLLGFQSRGVLGWILRLIVMRWGWGLLKLVFGRLLGARG